MNVDEQIDSLVRRFATRWNAYDAVGIAELFTPDADLVNAFGIAATGREAIEKFHVGLFGSLFKGGRFESETTRVRTIRPDVIGIELRWSVTGMKISDRNPRGEMDGLMAIVVTRDADAWLITMMHVMQFPVGQPAA